MLLAWYSHVQKCKPNWLSRSACIQSCQYATGSAANDTPIGGYTPITKQLWLERLQHGSGTTQEGITSKFVHYNFSTDSQLRENYRNPWDKMRIGRLFEDLDSLAGSIAFQHCYKDSQPPLLVTASVDEITLLHPISVHHDITMQGSVAWTGSSSLDILMTLTQPDYEQPSLTALFSFVNLDPATRKPSAVHPIQPHTPEQHALFLARQHVADERKRLRHANTASHGTSTPGIPSQAREFIQPLLERYQRFHELPALHGQDARAAVLIQQTVQSNTFIAQPQHRNTHGRIFGGILMRRAYELAFATAYTLSGTRPVFLKCDEITFRRPVDVGDLLRFRSSVLHTVTKQDGTGLVCVEVEASVAKLDQVLINTTNTFSFVFEVAQHPLAGPVKQVLPSSEEEGVKAWKAHQALIDSGFL